MEEEIKEMEKLIKMYNHFILFEPLRGLLLFFIAVANITVAGRKNWKWNFMVIFSSSPL